MRDELMKKIYVLFSLFVLLLFIGGCKTTGETKLMKAFVGGSKGLDISFVEGEPPEKVADFNSEQFRITLLLKNEGELGIEDNNVRVTLSGIGQNQFGMTEEFGMTEGLTKTNTNFISGTEKRREEILDGGEDEITYTAIYMPDLKQDFTPTITANVCYVYGTRTLTNLCLRKDIARKEREGECVVDEYKTIENSGAPIQVTSLSEMKGGTNTVRVIFNIENVGSGTVYEKGTFSSGDCSESNDNRDKENKLNVEIKPIGGVDIANCECARLGGGSKGVVKLNIEGKAVITCVASTAGLQSTAFEAPLNINLDYDYKERISRKITVENAVEKTV